ncbi:MAG: hypothetical protein K6A23_14475 [Butyrivibrio sp.]|nr:hypothetical protein [Butyrivibrio sp.]
MKRLFIRVKKILNNKEGMAMTEILVAFLVLMMCLSMLYTCMKLSSNMILKAADIDRNHAVYQRTSEESLVGSSYPSSSTGTVTYTFGSGYSLTLNTNAITGTDKEGNTMNIPVFAVEEEE